MKKRILGLVAGVMALVSVFTLTACGEFNPDKNITVVAREASSGTREAFDTKVTDGTHFLEEKVDGKKVYNSTKTAVEQTKTGTVLSKVASDEYAIGYISLGSVNDTVKVLKVGGVLPSEETVLDGSYKIQRPFVVMTKHGITMTERAADFMAPPQEASEKSEVSASAAARTRVKIFLVFIFIFSFSCFHSFI